MRLAYTILYVDDVTETLAFYERAFGLARRILVEGGDFGELETGATTLAFASLGLIRQLGKHPGRPEPERPAFEIAFTTEEVAAALERALAAGARLVQEPKLMPWGQTTAYVTDPNGFLVELCTPMASQS